MGEIKTMLDEQIKHDLEEISKQKVGDEKRQNAIDQVNDLHRMRIDELKLEQESEARERERKTKTKLDVAGLIVPNALLGTSLVMGFIIEKYGVISGKTFERVLRFIKPEKLIRFLK